MIRNAKPGDTAVLPNGNRVKIAQVQRSGGGRVRVRTTAGDEYAVWDLRPVIRRERRVKSFTISPHKLTMCST